MIEQLDPSDGRYTTIITKVNEVIDEINSLRRDFEALVKNFDEHHHTTYKGTESEGATGSPIITMIDERQED